MTQHHHLDPSAFELQGGKQGILLIHGFTGAPPEMRRLGDFLHERGMAVSAPLLPGHGTTPEEMNRQRWEDWTGHVEGALADLRRHCDTVFVGGLSMGALLTIHLAARKPDIAGIVLYAPALRIADRTLPLARIARHVMPVRPKKPKDLADPTANQRIYCYDVSPVAAAYQLHRGCRASHRDLPRVRCPALVVRSTGDTVIHATSAPRTLAGLGSSDTSMLTLRDSGHCLTADKEWRTVAERSWAFIQRVGVTLQ